MNTNETIELMKNRRSVRNFSDQKITDEVMENILQATQQVPNSINAQQTSIIVIKDEEKLKQIEELCGGYAKASQAQAFIVIAMDFNKTNYAIKNLGQEQMIQNTVEGLMIGSVDAGIVAQAISTAAGSYGIGSTIIGAVRNNPQGFIDLCNLPKYTFPVVGIMLGYPQEASAGPKSRLAQETFVHYEEYNDQNMLKHITDYDQAMDEYNKERGLGHLANYSKQVSVMYTKNPMPKVKEVLKAQGFDFN